MMAEVVNPSQVKVLVVNAMRGMVCKSVAITSQVCDKAVCTDLVLTHQLNINAMPHLTSVGTWVGIVGGLPPVWSPTRGGLEGICADHNAHASKATLLN